MPKSSSKSASELESLLSAFIQTHAVAGKGPLSVMLVITRRARGKTPPYDEKDFLSRRGGQVAGLGRSAVQSILAEFGITRILAEEGGRTSRGSIQRMRAYIDLLNDLNQRNILDFALLEEAWIRRIRNHFASQPIALKADPSKSLRHIVAELIDAAFARQQECPGTMVAGAVIEHLVGAKLQLALARVEIKHKGFSVADAPGKRKGDFLLGDTAIHVSTAPSEALLSKCERNLGEGIRPVIITTVNGAAGALALARNTGISDRIDILDVEQFIATNVYEWCEFERKRRPPTIVSLVETYNRIIDECETDPSLKILIG